MKLIGRIAIALAGNALALFLSSKLVDQFTISSDLKEFAFSAILLTLANLILRPITKFILKPFIVLSFGLLVIALNAGILYLIDIYSSGITITGLIPLILGTLIVSATNIALRVIAKIF